MALVVGLLAPHQRCPQPPAVGLLFMIPGVNEVLRINGRAQLRDDADLLERFAVEGRLPRLVVLVDIDSVYLHCAKALMRSRLWVGEAQVARSVLPSMAEMIRDQIDEPIQIESQAEAEARWSKELY